MVVPQMPISLMYRVYRKVLPRVYSELRSWREKACLIPDEELRRQALDSLDQKTFHCEGGGIMSLIAMDRYQEAITFIVAYQTISDYLDNLCDRSSSLDPEDFAALHEAMEDALTLDGPLRNYYRKRGGPDDAGYLASLVLSCREELKKLPNYVAISDQLFELCRFYCDLQVHKHVEHADRVPRLKKWHEDHQNAVPEMQWYEFSACAGSTLGVFCLVSYALRDDFKPEFAECIHNGYFPYIQGLHILLDYLIDQEEDRREGDLNFCFYYESEEKMFERLNHFIHHADRHTAGLPNRRFHQLINRGLLGVYLSDEKVQQQKKVKRLAKDIIRRSGPAGYFFYLNGLFYRAVQRWLPALRLEAAVEGKKNRR